MTVSLVADSDIAYDIFLKFPYKFYLVYGLLAVYPHICTYIYFLNFECIVLDLHSTHW